MDLDLLVTVLVKDAFSSFIHGLNHEVYAPLLRILDCILEQHEQNTLQPLCVGKNHLWKTRLDLKVHLQVLHFSLYSHRIKQVREHLANVEHGRQEDEFVEFDLLKLTDLVKHAQQNVARRLRQLNHLQARRVLELELEVVIGLPD